MSDYEVIQAEKVSNVSQFKEWAIDSAAKATGAVMALSMMAVTAFADGEGDVIETVTNSMTSELTSLVSKLGTAAAGIVGVGLTIFGIKWAVRNLKSFFNKIAG